MEDAVLVNPHSPDDVAHAIGKALDMKIDERRARYDRMVRTVRDDNVEKWTEDFVTDLTG